MEPNEIRNPRDLRYLKEHKDLRNRIRREELRVVVPSSADVKRRGITLGFSSGTLDSGAGGGGPYKISFLGLTPDFVTGEDVEILGSGDLRILTPGMWIGDYATYYKIKDGDSPDGFWQEYRLGARVLKNGQEICASECMPYPVDFDANAHVDGEVGGAIPSVLLNAKDVLRYELIPAWRNTVPLSRVTAVTGRIQLTLMCTFS